LRDVARDDLEVAAVGPQPGVAQYAGQITRGNYQDVPATAQDAMQRGGLAARADLNVGHALAGSRPGPAAVLAGQRLRRVGDVDLADPAGHPALDDRAAAEDRDDIDVVAADGAGPIVLVRPDGHVAARGRPGRMNAVTGYLRGLFGDPGSAPAAVPSALSQPAAVTRGQ